MDTRHRDDAVTDPGAIGAGGVGATVEATSPDAAVFSVAPVSGRRRRFPVAAAAVLGVGVLGIAVAGTLGRTQPLLKTPVIAKGPVTIDIPEVRSQSQRLAEGPFGPLDGRTGVTPGRTGPALITVEANRSGG